MKKLIRKLFLGNPPQGEPIGQANLRTVYAADTLPNATGLYDSPTHRTK